MSSPSHASVVDLDGLFRQHARELNGFVYQKLQDREAAADVVQDGFLRFLVWSRQNPDVSLVKSPRFFLWRIIGNLTIDVVRANRVRANTDPIDDYSNLLVDPHPGADRQLEARRQLAMLKAVLADLTVEQRTTLLLNRMEGMTHEEIAKRLNLSTSMVSKHIVAALRRCLKRLPSFRR